MRWDASLPLWQQNNLSCTEHILQISLFGDINLGCNPITAEVQGSLSMDFRGTRFSPLFRPIQVVINKHMAGKKNHLKATSFAGFGNPYFSLLGSPRLSSHAVPFATMISSHLHSTEGAARTHLLPRGCFGWCKQLRYCLKEITVLQRINSVAAFNFPLYKLWWAVGSKPRPHGKQHGTSYRPYGEK